MLRSCNTWDINEKHLTINNKETLCGRQVYYFFGKLEWDCKECTEILDILVEQLKLVDFIKEPTRDEI